MSDIYDKAQEQDEAFRTLALAQQAGKAGKESHPDFDGQNCLDCTGEIPDDRLALGKIRCIGCQEELEKRRKRGFR